MGVFYNIVPYDSGYYYLAQAKNGEYFINHKAYALPKDSRILIFKTNEEAERYIVKYLDPNVYTTEKVWRSDEYLCDECGMGLLLHCIVGSDQTESGMEELLGVCRNENCKEKWSIARTADGDLVSMERWKCE